MATGWIAASLIGAFVLIILLLNVIEFRRPD